MKMTKQKSGFSLMKSVTSLLLAFFLLIGLCGCKGSTVLDASSSQSLSAINLISKITPKNSVPIPPSDESRKQIADFSFSLLQHCNKDDKNTLLSPVSILEGFSMAANGADGDTLAELSQVLCGGESLDSWNGQMLSWLTALRQCENKEFTDACSIWLQNSEELTVNPDFLQTNADYYNAEAYCSDFHSQTVDEINRWVSKRTKKRIDSILKELDPEDWLVLLNAVTFDAEWEIPYHNSAVQIGSFTLTNGNICSVKLMHSQEFGYLQNGNCSGFVKYYKGRDFAFAALLPNEGVSADELVSTLDGEKWISMLQSISDENVSAAIPLFTATDAIDLKEPLQQMGIQDLFSNGANLSRMSNRDLMVSEARHKTYLTVDQIGTRAGAVTEIIASDTAAPLEPKQVVLNRPFIYAIIDTKTNLPVFLGILENPNQQES